MTATARVDVPAVAPAAARTSGMRRVGCALAMVLAPWGFVVANTAYMLAIRDGGNEDTGADTLALYGAHELLAHVAMLGGMLGCLLIVPAVMGAFRLVPTSRLTLIGGSLMVAGYICYFGVLNSGLSTLAMAMADPTSADFAAVIEDAQADAWGIWVFLLFVIGNLIGTILFAVGLLRSRRVPAWAALAIMTWPPLHVIGLAFFGNEVPQVIGAVLQAVGFAGCAVVLLRSKVSEVPA
jgi:hypothetical protein